DFFSICDSSFFFFFFSSRRRHTRLQGDWSSDVCSSDLGSARWPARRAFLRWKRLTSRNFEIPKIRTSKPGDLVWGHRKENVRCFESSGAGKYEAPVWEMACGERSPNQNR